MNRKILSLVLVISVLCSLFAGAVNVSAQSLFSDTEGHWAQQTIEELAGKGIVNGKGGGKFDPEGKVTRAEFIKLLVCIAEDEFTASEGVLADVPEDAWYNPYVYAAFNRGVFFLNELHGNLFVPNGDADRETVALWSVRLLGIESDTVNLPFNDKNEIENQVAVATAYNNGIIAGDDAGNFRPKDALTRAEAATIIKRVMVKYAELHTPRVSKNIVDYDDDVIEMSSSEEENNLSEANYDDGIFVFTNINDEIRNLKEGDIFIIKPCESVPEGLAVKAEDVRIVGDRAEITQGDLSLGEVIDEIDISQYVPITMDYLVEGSLGEGVTIAGDYTENGENYLADNGRTLIAANPMDALNLNFNINVKLTDDISLKGSMSLKDLGVDCDIDADKWNVKSIKLTESHKEELKVTLTGSKKWDALQDDARYKKDSFNDGHYTAGTKKSRNEYIATVYEQWKNLGINDLSKDFGGTGNKKEVKIASFNFPIGASGFAGIMDVRLTASLSGEVSASISLSTSETNGIQWTKGSGINKINERSVTQTFNVAGKATAKVGASFRAGLTFLHVVTVDAGISGGIGAGVSAELLKSSAEWKLSNGEEAVTYKTGGLLNFADDLTASYKNNQVKVSEIHTCDLCVDGDIYLYLTIDAKAEAGLGKAQFTLFNPTWDIFDAGNAKIADFYISVDFGDHIEAGWGTCPYIFKTPKIVKQSDSRAYEEGEFVTLYSFAHLAEAAAYEGKNLIDCLTDRNSTIYEAAAAIYNSDEAYGELMDSVRSQGFTFSEEPVYYQWYKDGKAIDGANDSILQIDKLTQERVGVYNCVVMLQADNDMYAVSKDIEITIDNNTLTGTEKSQVKTAKTSKFTGSVSEDKTKESFSYTAPTTGKYYFANEGKENVFIIVDGIYCTNEGNFDLTAGKTYTVEIGYYLENTPYSVNVYAPSETEDISGSVSVTGKLTFKGEVKTYRYTCVEDGQYVFDAGDDLMIKVEDSAGNYVGEGNPKATVVLKAGNMYTIKVSCPGKNEKSYKINLSRHRLDA